MAYHLDIDLDSGFEPQQRARSNTWPLPRPENYVENGDVDTLCNGAARIAAEEPSSRGCDLDRGASVDSIGAQLDSGPVTLCSAAAAAAAAKKNSSRRNAWGNMSYADLITQAIQSSPDKRLTLSQIYDWMVQNVPYFKDKGDSNSSAGWKNSIRHNLSLHNRFMRVQNEGTGKSSWWMINPDAKPGKSARRRATSMETSKYEKKRGRVKKKVEALRAGLTTTPSPSSSISEGLDMFPESPQMHHHVPHYPIQQLSPGDFRPRASSNASSIGRLSPIPAASESEMQEPAWSPTTYHMGGTTKAFDCFPDNLLDLAENMKIRESNCYTRKPAPTKPDNSFSLYNSLVFPNSLMEIPMQDSADFPTPECSKSSKESSPKVVTEKETGFINDLSSMPLMNPLPALQGLPTAPMPTTVMHALQPMQDGTETYNEHHSRNHATLIDRYRSAGQSNGAENDVPDARLDSGLLRAALSQGNVSPGQHLSNSSPPVNETYRGQMAASQVMGHLMGVLNNNGTIAMPNDLDLNLDSLQGGFDCNVDEVIKHELSMDGSLDFNFSQQQQQQQQQQQLLNPQAFGVQSQANHFIQQGHIQFQQDSYASNTFDSQISTGPSSGGGFQAASVAPVSSGRSWVR